MDPTALSTPSAATPPTRRVWPLTAGLVVLGAALVATDLFGAAITTAPFFGDVPSRAQYLHAGSVLVTAVVPLALLAVTGWLAGSRWGLALLALLALVALVAGGSMLGQTGDSSDPDPTRHLRADDFWVDLNALNAIATAVAALVIVATLVVRLRRRGGASGRGSSSTSA